MEAAQASWIPSPWSSIRFSPALLQLADRVIQRMQRASGLGVKAWSFTAAHLRWRRRCCPSFWIVLICFDSTKRGRPKWFANFWRNVAWDCVENEFHSSSSHALRNFSQQGNIPYQHPSSEHQQTQKLMAGFSGPDEYAHVLEFCVPGNLHCRDIFLMTNLAKDAQVLEDLRESYAVLCGGHVHTLTEKLLPKSDIQRFLEMTGSKGWSKLHDFFLEVAIATRANFFLGYGASMGAKASAVSMITMRLRTFDGRGYWCTGWAFDPYCEQNATHAASRAAQALSYACWRSTWSIHPSWSYELKLKIGRWRSLSCLICLWPWILSTSPQFHRESGSISHRPKAKVGEVNWSDPLTSGSCKLWKRNNRERYQYEMWSSMMQYVNIIRYMMLYGTWCSLYVLCYIICM